MPARVLEHRTLYRSERFFSAFPSLARLQTGEILLAFRRAPDHRWLLGPEGTTEFQSVDHVHYRSHIALCRFNADLAPLGDARSMPTHPEAGDQDGNLFVTRDGRLLQYGFLWYPILGSIAEALEDKGFWVHRWGDRKAPFAYWGSYVRYSDDSGLTWSDYVAMPADPLHVHTPWPDNYRTAALRGRMVELKDGSLLMAGYQGGLKGHGMQVTRLLRSADNGESWSVQDALIGMPDIALQEPALASWPVGQITAFHRTAGHDDQLVIATSGDQGASFGPPRTVPVMGHPYDPLVLKDGRLFLVYGYRHEPMGVRARIVEPGQAIEDAEEIVIRDDSPSRDTGYPSAVQLSDGRIAIAYYISDARGIRGIEATLIELG